VTAFSRQGGIILDPFIGSGNTGIAAWEMGRRFIGVELDRNYYDMTQIRLQEYKSKKQPVQEQQPRTISAGYRKHQFAY
jgi:site-specific DNA-methyltransferase (adenine-specific)